MGNLFTDLFTNDNEEEAARQKAAGLKAGQAAAGSELDAGFNNASGYYGKATDAFSGLMERGNRGYDTYLDATGVNGADGIGRAGDLYRSLPGYNAGQTMGLDLLERRAAARGDLGGGNTSADTIKFASDYDSTKYKDFLAGLMPNLGVASGATAGTAGIYGQQGNLAADIGGKKAQYGYGTETGIGNANAEATMANENSSKNFWGALMGGANLLAKTGTGGLFGGFGGSGTADAFQVGSQAFPMYR
jgi:hypothetical protein